MNNHTNTKVARQHWDGGVSCANLSPASLTRGAPGGCHRHVRNKFISSIEWTRNRWRWCSVWRSTSWSRNFVSVGKMRWPWRKRCSPPYLYWTGKAKVDRWTLFPTKRRGYLISSSKNIFLKKKTKNINILSVGLKLEGATCSSPQRRTWSSAFDFTLTPPVEKLLLFRGSAARGRIGTAFITFLVLGKNHLVPQKTEISVICCRRKEANKFSQRLHGRKKTNIELEADWILMTCLWMTTEQNHWQVNGYQHI